MKKAKKLLAVIMAAVMLLSAACLPVYAKQAATKYGAPEQLTTNQKYYFNADQGCSYLLDLLDEMLAEAYIVLTWDNLVGGSFFGGIVEGIVGRETIDFSSVDNAIQSIFDLIDVLDSGAVNTIGGWIVGDLDYLEKTYLDPGMKRGNRSDNYSTGSNDMKILFSLVSWLGDTSVKDLLARVISGSADLGLLENTITGINIAGMPLLQDVDKYLPVLLYQLLVDDTVTADTMPEGATIETGLQKIVNWALIDGTGEAPENGGTSLLGANFEPLIGNALTYDQVNISNLSVYDLGHNLINGLLNGLLAPMLGDLIADLVGIEEDGSVSDESTFNLIIGIVEGLLVDNGAKPPVYTEPEDARTPGGIVNDLVDWLFKDGALQVFIKIERSGLGLTDNFMSLLYDLIRIAINLLPALGLEIPDGLLPSADALTDTYYYKVLVNEETGEETKVQCLKTDDEKVDQLYQTYYGKNICFPVYKADGKTIDYYKYFGGEELTVNTTDENGANYENPDFIRPYYIMSMDQVWAAVVKAVFTLISEGPYFRPSTPDLAVPTDTMEAVLAYGVAGLAASVIPEGNWYDRLDAYAITGSTEPYEIRTGVTVVPLAFNDSSARSATKLPTGAMEIAAGLGAYYLNTMLDLSTNQRLTVLNTSFEQLLTELGLWAMTKYIPILAGDINPSTGLAYTSQYTGPYGEARYPATFAAETNVLINQIYENFPSRKLKANPNWNAIYDYLDSTLLSLLPAGWLPDEYYDSYSLFNDWLFGNIVKFDLQGLLGILSANSTGELNEPLLVVLLRVIDRVLATVFAGEAVMLPTDRNGKGSNSVFNRHTSITSLTALIDDGDGSVDGSLPQFLVRLLTLLNKHKGLLLATFLPMLLGGTWERPFDRNALKSENNFVNVLGTDMTRYKISDLENQIRTLTKNVNAIQINRTPYVSTTPVEYGVYSSAEAAAAAQAELGENYISTEQGTAEDGSATYTVYRGLNADDVLEQFKAQYGEDADIYVDTVEKVASTATTPAIYEFNVYQSKDFYTSADHSTVTDEFGVKNKFTNFRYKSIIPASTSNPLAKWDSDAYYFWESEDSNPNAYYYANVKDSVTKAEAFVDSYKSFATSTLPSAFGAWFEYSIDAYMVSAGLYDSNLDGKSVLSTSDSDYVPDNADTADVNEETPVDGYPSVPTAMYPYYNDGDTTQQTWVDPAIDEAVTRSRNSFNRTNFELLVMAEAYGNDVRNNVLLDLFYTEKVVRYALWANNGNNVAEAMKFDITANADGSYTGNGTASRQWKDLSAAEIAAVKNLCDGYYMYLEQNDETGEYEIYRKAFTYASNLQYLQAADGSNNLDAMPITSRHYVRDDGPSDHQKAQNAIYDGYIDYIKELYSLRRSVYNQLDTLNWRFKTAEENRATSVDPTMLNWALALTKDAYSDSQGRRNQKYESTVDGVEIYTKVYTSSTYAEFQKAYEYASDLSKSGIGEGQVVGTTQSMVTKAYQNLLAAYNKLVEYLGDADWVQYKETFALAQQLSKTVAEGGYADHETLGLQPESRQALLDVITQALAFSGDLNAAGETFRKENFDCERQTEIDAMWASIDAVIKNLKYLSNPNITISAGSDNLMVETSKEYDNQGNAYTYGWIFGLEEGKGLDINNVTIVGMLVNETKGDFITSERSALGMGTGSRIDGYVDNGVRFSYRGILYGDLNGDARIDGTDWAKLSYYLLTGQTGLGMGEDHTIEAANADHMAGITIADADLIKAHYNYSKTINQKTSSYGTGTTGL